MRVYKKLNILRSSYTLLLFCSVLACNKAIAQEIEKPVVPKNVAEDYLKSLNRNSLMVDFIENVLAQNGLPKMLRNLAMIESDFDKNCISSAQAVGVWQFTKDAANYYGLLDSDRFDVYKSTYAVIKNLKDLYNKYHNWITVIAAYNCGEGNISKAIQKAGSNKYHLFYTHLPAETINHVYKFMMACIVTNEFNYLAADYKAFLLGVPNTPPEKEEALQNKLSVDSVNSSLVSTEINASFNVNIIAEEINIPFDELKKWNQNIEKNLAQNGVSLLFLPADLMPNFLLLKNKILNRSLNNIKSK